MRSLSEYFAFIVIILIIIVLLFPIFYYILSISSPGAKQGNFQEVINNQINGGSVLIFYNDTNIYKPQIDVIRPNGNLTIIGAFYENVNWIPMTLYYKGQPVNFPVQLIYNFSMDKSIPPHPVLLEIAGYNTTTFVLILPNETAIAP